MALGRRTRAGPTDAHLWRWHAVWRSTKIAFGGIKPWEQMVQISSGSAIQMSLRASLHELLGWRRWQFTGLCPIAVQQAHRMRLDPYGMGRQNVGKNPASVVRHGMMLAMVGVALRNSRSATCRHAPFKQLSWSWRPTTHDPFSVATLLLACRPVPLHPCATGYARLDPMVAVEVRIAPWSRTRSARATGSNRK